MDVFWVAGLAGMLGYYDAILQYAPHARVIFDTIDLQYLREFRAAQVTHNAAWLKTALQTQRLTHSAVRSAHCTITVSSAEQAILERECPGEKVQVLSTIHEVRPRKSDYRARNGSLFVGNFNHTPNTDAVRYFLDEIKPKADKELQALEIFIAGADPPAWLAARASKPLHILGHVPDLEPLLQSSRVSIAPIRFGAGVNSKVLESMSAGLPVVSTTFAAQGLGAEHERDLLIADTPDAFAASLLRLHRDAELWERLSTNGQALVSRDFSFEAARRNLALIFSSVLFTYPMR
jgi:glycosyltransferase involved in cell wall biosynthesis